MHSILTEEGKETVKVMSADTDVFVLMCHYFSLYWVSKEVYMDKFSSGSKLISIKKSVSAKPELIASLVAVHAISGCDHVPMMFGIGKVKPLNVAEKIPLKHVGEKSAEIKEVVDEGKRFVAKCYGQVNVSSSKNRRAMWIAKTDGAKKSAKPPALKSLPPTDEALEVNIKRAHYVAIQWKSCISGNLPDLDPCDFGWEKDGESLRPIMLPDGIDVAPKKVLEMTRCKCKTQCKTNRCSCVKAKTSCSEFCGCQGCENHKDNSCDNDDESDESDEFDEFDDMTQIDC